MWNVLEEAPEAAQAVPGSQAGVIQAGTLSKTDVGVLHTMFCRQSDLHYTSCRNLLHPVICLRHHHQGCHTAGTPGADSSAGAHAVLDEALRYCQGDNIGWTHVLNKHLARSREAQVAAVSVRLQKQNCLPLPLLDLVRQAWKTQSTQPLQCRCTWRSLTRRAHGWTRRGASSTSSRRST